MLINDFIKCKNSKTPFLTHFLILSLDFVNEVVLYQHANACQCIYKYLQHATLPICITSNSNHHTITNNIFKKYENKNAFNIAIAKANLNQGFSKNCIQFW